MNGVARALRVLSVHFYQLRIKLDRERVEMLRSSISASVWNC